MEEKKQEKWDFELRSEKVRSIVGEIPTSLVRFSFISIGVVIFSLFAIVYFMPYKQVYSGTAVIHEVKSIAFSDSTETDILLRFEKRRPNNVSGQLLYLQSPKGRFAGKILNLSTIRDTLERQSVTCRFKTTEIKLVENQTMDFQLVLSLGNLLQKMLRDIGF